ncbi:sortase B protein-sorting domain-containing protein [Sphingobacterium paramultivorum]
MIWLFILIFSLVSAAVLAKRRDLLLRCLCSN